MIYRSDGSGIKRNVTRILLVLAGLAFTLAYAALIGESYLNETKYNSPNWLNPGLSVLSTSLIASLFLCAFTNTINSKKRLIVENTFLICALCLASSLFELFHGKLEFNNDVIFSVSLAINTMTVYYLTLAYSALLNLNLKWPQLPAIINIFLTLILGVLTASNLNSGGFERSILELGLVVHAICLFAPISIFLSEFAISSLSDGKTEAYNLLNRAFDLNHQRTEAITSVAIFSISLVTTAATLHTIFSEFDTSVRYVHKDPYYPMANFHITWIPLAVYAYRTFREEYQKSAENQTLTGLVSQQAKNFLARHHSKGEASATTIGLRTANFMIDHDPKEDVKTVLPSYMVHIRQTQIQKLVKGILGDQLIDGRNVSNQMFGAIDPQHTIRSCTDVLLMFTSLYIDGIPLVESRLKNIIKLLPILDPTLSKQVEINHVEKSLGKVQWFFHLDFDWLDQHMNTNDAFSSYEVKISNLKLRDRQKILSILEEHNLMGNFIWVGEKARERLLLEAPYLANIIEAWPINLDSDNVNDKSVIFLIKFEQLIPRMQKYYNLEDIRNRLKYYEPTLESRRMINIIDLEIQQSSKPKDILEILTMINNFPWQGFKEKDIALGLILKAFERYEEELQNSTSSSNNKIIDSLVDSIRNIGYPSQEIHSAHIEKIRIRKASSIKETLLNPNHPRFNEAWLLVATTPAKNYSRSEIVSLIEGLIASAENKQNYKRKLVASKITEAFFNLAQELEEGDIELLTAASNSIIRYLVMTHAEPELFSFYIDAKVFLESNLKIDIPLEASNLELVQSHFSEVFEKHGSDSSIVRSLSMRWKILVNQAGSVNSAS